MRSRRISISEGESYRGISANDARYPLALLPCVQRGSAVSSLTVEARALRNVHGNKSRISCWERAWTVAYYFTGPSPPPTPLPLPLPLPPPAPLQLGLLFFSLSLPARRPPPSRYVFRPFSSCVLRAAITLARYLRERREQSDRSASGRRSELIKKRFERV